VVVPSSPSVIDRLLAEQQTLPRATLLVSSEDSLGVVVNEHPPRAVH
jgi:hypothetical protein